jgi:hypothetical protein
MIKERDRVSRLRLISPLVSLLVSLTSVRSGDLLSSVTFWSYKFYSPRVFSLRPTHLDTLITGIFTRIWWFHFSKNT